MIDYDRSIRRRGRRRRPDPNMTSAALWASLGALDNLPDPGPAPVAWGRVAVVAALVAIVTLALLVAIVTAAGWTW